MKGRNWVFLFIYLYNTNCKAAVIQYNDINMLFKYNLLSLLKDRRLYTEHNGKFTAVKHIQIADLVRRVSKEDKMSTRTT